MSCNYTKDSCNYTIDGRYVCQQNTVVPNKTNSINISKQKIIISKKPEKEKFSNNEEENEDVEQFDEDEDEDVEKFDEDEQDEQENFNGHKEHITNAPYKKCLCE